MSGVEVKRGPGRPKKSEAKEAADEAVVAFAKQVVETLAERERISAEDNEQVRRDNAESDRMETLVRPCSLEDAPVGSKVVVSRNTDGQKEAHLITPSDRILLPKTDLAYTLPVCAKVRIKMPSLIETVMLDSAPNIPPLITSTAREAMEQYLTHFKLKD